MIKKILKKNAALAAICTLFFAAGMPLGYVFFSQAEGVLTPVLEQLKDLASKETELETVAYILFNNYRVCIYLLAAGFFVVPTFFMMLANGFVIGYVIKLLENKNLGLMFFLKGITAHGIFELPAIFLSAAIGLRMGISYLKPEPARYIRETLMLFLASFGLFTALAIGAYAGWRSIAAIAPFALFVLMTALYAKNPGRLNRVKHSMGEAAVIHFIVVVPLLILAAFIEVFVSAALVAN